jgi:hypothetical protein
MQLLRSNSSSNSKTSDNKLHDQQGTGVLTQDSWSLQGQGSSNNSSNNSSTG